MWDELWELKIGGLIMAPWFKYLREGIGGEGGIRTPDTLASMPHFECGAFNRSATSPQDAFGPEKAQIGRPVI